MRREADRGSRRRCWRLRQRLVAAVLHHYLFLSGVGRVANSALFRTLAGDLHGTGWARTTSSAPFSGGDGSVGLYRSPGVDALGRGRRPSRWPEQPVGCSCYVRSQGDATVDPVDVDGVAVAKESLRQTSTTLGLSRQTRLPEPWAIADNGARRIGPQGPACGPKTRRLFIAMEPH
jgi:hypothetical protein